MNFKLRLNSFAVTLRYTPAFVLLVILFSAAGCSSNSKPPTDQRNFKDDSNTISWNILFPATTNLNTRLERITKIKADITEFYNGYNKQNNTKYTVVFDRPRFCPCDSLLFNLNFLAIDGEGESLTRGQPQPKPAGEGDLVSVNIPVTDNSKVTENSDNKPVNINKSKIDDSKILAIIDSGIDPELFPNDFARLIWLDPSALTLFNFIPGENRYDMQDRTSVKHGTAVATIVYDAMKNYNKDKYSKLMILRALDQNNEGSIFSISCALSYANQKKATLINMSLGYYGAPDSILLHYLKLTKEHSIEVFAAAGNTRDNHTVLQLCDTNPNGNFLGDTVFFYPACFTRNLSNITSVTQMNKVNTPCYYQNFSNKFISLGIYDTANCCKFPVRFSGGTTFYEGSSFATPAASGLRMGTLLSPPGSLTDPWTDMMENTSTNVTIGGKYISYPPNP
ncbi:MAG: S8/S53 family peptidase [Ferruginibacter sp.]